MERKHVSSMPFAISIKIDGDPNNTIWYFVFLSMGWTALY